MVGIETPYLTDKEIVFSWKNIRG